MPDVSLRAITAANLEECIGLALDRAQVGWIASNVKSLAEERQGPGLPAFIYLT